MFVTDRQAQSGPYRIFRLLNGTRTAVTQPPDYALGDSDPACSPDGQMLAFVRTGKSRSIKDVHAIALHPLAKTSKRLSDVHSEIAGLAWAGGRRLIFSSTHAGPPALWTADIETDRIDRLSGPVNALYPTTARGMLAFARMTEASSIRQNRCRLTYNVPGERRHRRAELQMSCLKLTLGLAVTTATWAAVLPGRYFELLEAGSRQVESRLAAGAGVTLEALETAPGWRHFGYSILAPAVLYARRHPANPRYHDKTMLALAVRIGDLLASEQEKGKFTPRLDSDWDTYIWLEAYRLLQDELGAERRARWKKAILENAAPLAAPAAERMDFPWFNSPYIGTSPNHYAQWAELLYLAGVTFAKPEWVKLGAAILHRFVAEEQTSDGYWGEHSRAGPTTNYDYVTLSAIGVYWEHTKDPAALEALRRSTAFHTHFTYPDGTPVETINDRNRYGPVEPWAQFAFTNFPEGRRYAEFLTGFFSTAKLSMDALGRLAQDALYYHEGPAAPIPQDRQNYVYRMSIPAGIRKTGPWVVCLSGIVDTQAATNQFYLDRQSNLSVFHSKLGLIVNGANSKRQAELATFRERVGGVTYHLPLSSRLQMSDDMRDTPDRLSVAFNSFFSDLYVPPPSAREIDLRFVISGKGRAPEEAFTTLQLVLTPGEVLQTAAGKNITVGQELLELGPEAIGAWIRHHGWTMYLHPAARLVWPVHPFNPYANAAEEGLAHAVAALSVPIRLQAKQGHPVRPNEQEIKFRLATE